MSGAVGVRVESVARHYPTPGGIVRAVDGISLEIEPGSNLAIAGPSGSGKSTLLSLIGGLETPTSGRVIVGGKELSTMTEAARTRLRRGMGLVHQADNLLPFLTAEENVSMQLSLAGMEGQGDTGELLAELGLADGAGKLPHQLSRGERRRVAVARAIVARPGLILADEPTGSLDATNASAVVELLKKAQRQSPATVVVVTHDLLIANQFERVLTLHDGRLADELAKERPGADACVGRQLGQGPPVAPR